MGQSIKGLSPFLKPGQIILLGEVHGTIEAPKYVVKIVEQALSQHLTVFVGLELPSSDEFTIKRFMEVNESNDKEFVLRHFPDFI